MALTDSHWNKVLTVLNLKAEETGISADDFGEMILLIKENWELLSVERSLDAYIKTAQLPLMEAQKIDVTAQLERINKLIAELKK